MLSIVNSQLNEGLLLFHVQYIYHVALRSTVCQLYTTLNFAAIFLID